MRYEKYSRKESWTLNFTSTFSFTIKKKRYLAYYSLTFPNPYRDGSCYPPPGDSRSCFVRLALRTVIITRHLYAFYRYHVSELDFYAGSQHDPT